MTSSGTERACWVARPRSRIASRSGVAAVVMGSSLVLCGAEQITLSRRVLVGAEVSRAAYRSWWCDDRHVIEESDRRRIIVVLIAGVGVMLVYWTAWYPARSLVASNTRSAYYEFENAFPLADAWLALCCVGAIVALRGRKPIALMWLLLAAGAGVYLFGMDVLYDLEQGIWWSSGAGGVIELGINALTIGVSLWFLRWTWLRRDALLSAH